MKITILTVVVIIAVFALIQGYLFITTKCVYFPWKAWRYEDSTQAKFFENGTFQTLQEAQKNINQVILNEYFIEDTFIHFEIIDSNKIIISGRMPAESNVNKVMIHDITLTSSSGKRYTPDSIGSLSFPITIEKEQIKYIEGKDDSYNEFSVLSLVDLDLKPESGESIKVQITIETYANRNSTQTTLRRTLTPIRKSEMMRCFGR